MNMGENYDAVAKGRGRSRLSVVPAESGMGKSKLLREFRSYLLKHKIRSSMLVFPAMKIIYRLTLWPMVLMITFLVFCIVTSQNLVRSKEKSIHFRRHRSFT